VSNNHIFIFSITLILLNTQILDILWRLVKEHYATNSNTLVCLLLRIELYVLYIYKVGFYPRMLYLIKLLDKIT
jgi:hypothetical protein